VDEASRLGIAAAFGMPVAPAGYANHDPGCLRKKPVPGGALLRNVTLMSSGERTTPSDRPLTIPTPTTPRSQDILGLAALVSTLDWLALREGLYRRLPGWRWRDDLKGREDHGIVQRDESWRGVRLRGLQLGDSGDPLVRRQRGRCLRLR
jgi:hypothetical protein